MKAWKRKIMPEQQSRGSLLQVHALHYHDELLRDLDIECRRKSNFVAEIFGAYLPADDKDIQSVYRRNKAAPRLRERAPEQRAAQRRRFDRRKPEGRDAPVRGIFRREYFGYSVQRDRGLPGHSY